MPINGFFHSYSLPIHMLMGKYAKNLNEHVLIAHYALSDWMLKNGFFKRAHRLPNFLISSLENINNEKWFCNSKATYKQREEKIHEKETSYWRITQLFLSFVHTLNNSNLILWVINSIQFYFC